jgi:hypothetical protein
LAPPGALIVSWALSLGADTANIAANENRTASFNKFFCKIVLLLASLEQLASKGREAIMCKVLIGMMDREYDRALEIYVSRSRGVKENRDGTKEGVTCGRVLLVA